MSRVTNVSTVVCRCVMRRVLSTQELPRLSTNYSTWSPNPTSVDSGGLSTYLPTTTYNTTNSECYLLYCTYLNCNSHPFLPLSQSIVIEPEHQHNNPHLPSHEPPIFVCLFSLVLLIAGVVVTPNPPTWHSLCHFKAPLCSPFLSLYKPPLSIQQ